MLHARSTLTILALTLLSGIADARGFIHASRIWKDSVVNWREVGLSALGFGLGITCYWASLRFLQEAGIVAAEIQTTIWFSVTLIGVAITSGSFVEWRRIDQLVAVVTIACVVWLVIRTAE